MGRRRKKKGGGRSEGSGGGKRGRGRGARGGGGGGSAAAELKSCLRDEEDEARSPRDHLFVRFDCRPQEVEFLACETPHCVSRL